MEVQVMFVVTVMDGDRVVSQKYHEYEEDAELDRAIKAHIYPDNTVTMEEEEV